MDIHASTRGYENWLETKIPLIPADLALKHRLMSQGAFPFLRATFYRWVQRLPEICPEVMDAPVVLAVGDLHVENFGIWRDTEGRLAWGINDFDEAYPMAYTNDLVRLATSVMVAASENRLSIDLDDACNALLDGYTQSLETGGEPFVLAEKHGHLCELAINSLRDPEQYWQKLDSLAPVGILPAEVTQLLEAALPEPGIKYFTVHREAGLGSLGRQRFTAIAQWRGGKIAREIKQLTISACLWEKEAPGPEEILCSVLLNQADRPADPFTYVRNGWLLRRLTPDCTRIELADLSRVREEDRLLRAMGWETANQHLGSPEAIPAVLADLKKRGPKWLCHASESMFKATYADWQDWKKGL